jgi:hypothetical protein
VPPQQELFSVEPLSSQSSAFSIAVWSEPKNTLMVSRGTEIEDADGRPGCSGRRLGNFWVLLMLIRRMFAEPRSRS